MKKQVYASSYATSRDISDERAVTLVRGICA